MHKILEQLEQLSRTAAEGGDVLSDNAPRCTPVLRIVPDI
jgi:hypothetical protein